MTPPLSRVSPIVSPSQSPPPLHPTTHTDSLSCFTSLHFQRQHYSSARSRPSFFGQSWQRAFGPEPLSPNECQTRRVPLPPLHPPPSPNHILNGRHNKSHNTTLSSRDVMDCIHAKAPLPPRPTRLSELHTKAVSRLCPTWRGLVRPFSVGRWLGAGVGVLRGVGMFVQRLARSH